MHGPGYGPPQPRPTGAVPMALRVLFAVVPLASCGLLSWTALLRLAIVTRRRAHWALFWSQLTLYVVFFAFVVASGDDENDWKSNFGMIGLLSLATVTTAYFLYADIRHGARPAPATGTYGPPVGYAPPHIPRATAPQFGPYANPYAETPVPGASPAPAPMPAAPAPGAPVPPQLRTPAAPRIDQVRAELDELSQYLRKGTEGEAR
ncbi:hypothetical protein [Streptomyces sp. NBC_00083]|uniref:hypothetical protein n=1 Tax=Streptomyces sp. NBC_00083 TaxID=2975647 RepID=UPI002250BC89|nr:hypothetical protein [Streptomyces sp. NBC_00083]MCX5381999.1 hypothetical protein [Streptomyces sp. NBC_00083]